MTNEALSASPGSAPHSHRANVRLRAMPTKSTQRRRAILLSFFGSPSGIKPCAELTFVVHL